MQRFPFYIDSVQGKACNLQVAQKPFAQGVLFTPSDIPKQAIRDKPS